MTGRSSPPRSGRPPYMRLWLCAFALTATSAVTIQFVVLGWIFPEWSNGQGLLLNTDSIGYHNMAVELAKRIATEGWAAWEIAPSAHFSVGLAAAHYALIAPKPWLLIPAAAAATALSTLILMRICLHFTDDWRLAALAAAPYMLFPSSAFLYAQLLKDTYFNLGILLFGYGWMILAARKTWEAGWRGPALGLVFFLLGYAIMGMIRPYALTLMSWTATLLAVVSISILLVQVRDGLQSRNAITAAGIIAVGLLAIYEGSAKLVHSEFVPLAYTDEQVTVEARLNITKGYWERTPWVPSFLDKKLATLAGVRHAYLYWGNIARSEIDKEYDFKNSGEVLLYLPRAAQIAFLAPFPIHWFGEGSTRATTAMRRISMVEMLTTYLALLFVPYALWRWRRRGEIWVLFMFCLCILMVYSVATPNVGTLYRVRYAYLMVFVAFGVLAAGHLWREWWIRRRGAVDRLIPGTAEQGRADV